MNNNKNKTNNINRKFASCPWCKRPGNIIVYQRLKSEHFKDFHYINRLYKYTNIEIDVHNNLILNNIDKDYTHDNNGQHFDLFKIKEEQLIYTIECIRPSCGFKQIVDNSQIIKL